MRKIWPCLNSHSLHIPDVTDSL